MTLTDRCTRCGEPPAGSWAFTSEWEASHLCITCLNEPPAADRVTALTLRCGQLREQRDEARAAAGWEETADTWRRRCDEARRERDAARSAFVTATESLNFIAAVKGTT